MGTSYRTNGEWLRQCGIRQDDSDLEREIYRYARSSRSCCSYRVIFRTQIEAPSELSLRSHFSWYDTMIPFAAVCVLQLISAYVFGSGTKLAGHSDGIWCLKYVPGLNILLSGSSDGTVRLWSLDPRVMSCVRVLEGHSSDVYGLDAEVRFARVTPELLIAEQLNQRASANASDNAGSAPALDAAPSLARVSSVGAKPAAAASATNTISAAGNVALRTTLTIVSASADETARVWTFENDRAFDHVTLQQPSGASASLPLLLRAGAEGDTINAQGGKDKPQCVTM